MPAARDSQVPQQRLKLDPAEARQLRQVTQPAGVCLLDRVRQVDQLLLFRRGQRLGVSLAEQLPVQRPAFRRQADVDLPEQVRLARPEGGAGRAGGRAGASTVPVRGAELEVLLQRPRHVCQWLKAKARRLLPKARLQFGVSSIVTGMAETLYPENTARGPAAARPCGHQNQIARRPDDASSRNASSK